MRPIALEQARLSSADALSGSGRADRIAGGAAASADDPEAIAHVAREFESLFFQQLFKAMRATIPKDGMLDGGFAEEVFTDMLDGEYALLASREDHLGLAGAIARELGAPAPDPARARTARAAYAAQAKGGLGPGHAAAGLGAANSAPSVSVGSATLRAPVEGRLSSGYGPRSLSGGPTRAHLGLDFAAPTGTPIRAAASGIVTHAGPRGSYGNLVEIDHGDGLMTRYAHTSRVDVAVGQRVEAGATVAEVGSTGRSTGPHLHFEVRVDGEPVDPTPYLSSPETLSELRRDEI